MKHLISTLLATVLLSSCADPIRSQLGYYQSDISPQERARNRALVNRVEDESYGFRQRERMGQAAAIDRATCNSPYYCRPYYPAPRCIW